MTKRWKLALLVFFTVILVLVASGAFLRMNTKKHSPVDKITYAKGDIEITIVYCQPAKKGRLIFGEEADEALQPWGEYWRLGANEATTFKSNTDVKIGDHHLPAGFYSIYAVPGKDTWKISINSAAKRWGYAEPNYDKDILTISVPVTYSDQVMELFTMTFEPTDTGADLVMHWDTSIVKVPLR